MGRARLIRANDESPLVKPLREILVVVTGPVVLLAEEFARIDGIETAFLYGSFAARMLGDAGPAPHDIDLMVLGDPDVDGVYEACTRVESSVHRPVNPTILTPAEFAEPSGFLDNVRSGPAVAVVGELAVALTPLTRVQQVTVLTLVEARRLDVVPADLARATSFLRQAEERLDRCHCSRASPSGTASPTTRVMTLARHCWRRTASARPTGPANTKLSAATSAPCSTASSERRRRESSTACAALATRTVTRRSRWVPRRLRRPSKSPACSSTPPSREASRPARRSANSPQEVRRRPILPGDAQRSGERVSARQRMVSAPIGDDH